MFFLLKDRHIVEYQESMQKIEALRNSTGVTTFTVKVCTVDLSLFVSETSLWLCTDNHLKNCKNLKF